jgi:hypothetical protein
MDSFPDLSTETKCRELLDRYLDNVYVKDRLASILRSQGRNDEASAVLPDDSSYLKYDFGLLEYDEHIRQHPRDSVAYPKGDLAPLAWIA